MFKKLKKPFIIAEIGNNHEGKFIIAKKLVEEAAKARVDAVKFQTFDANSFISSKEKKRLKMLKKFQLSKDEFFKLYKIAKAKKIKFISTPLDINSALFLGKFVDLFKIASGDNDYFELIKTVLDFKKPTIISTGLIKMFEIKRLVNFVKKNKFPLNKLSLLHCVSSYPADLETLNLNFISLLKKKIDNKIKIGYSDHSIGLSAPLAAFTLGSDIIEKHFTLDNNFSSFRDHKLSLNPKDMSFLVNTIEGMVSSYGKKYKKISNSEKFILPQMRRSYYFTSDIKRDQLIKYNDIIFKRPRLKGSELNYNNIVGKKINIESKKESVILKKLFLKNS